MLQKLHALITEKGQGIVEYAMVLGFVAILAVGLWTSNLFTQSQRIVNTVSDNLSRSSNVVSNATLKEYK